MISNSSHIEYFHFEEDFISDNLRCIPMVVRLKLDTVGIKLPLKAWSRFMENERTLLALDPCRTEAEILGYKNLVWALAKKYSIGELAILDLGETPAWNNPDRIPETVLEKSSQFKQQISNSQWGSLTLLQRFALVKLSRPGHESKNFIKALAEFGLFK